MVVNEEFKKIVQKRYEELVANNRSSGVLNKETLGEVMLFINQKPKHFLASFTMGTDTLYIGHDKIE